MVGAPDLAELAGVEVLLTDDLALDGDALVHAPTGRPIAVAYRRTDVDRLRDDAGRPTSLGQLLREPLRAGKLSLMNWFGTGVADDKRVHAHVDALTRITSARNPSSDPSPPSTSPIPRRSRRPWIAPASSCSSRATATVGTAS